MNRAVNLCIVIQPLLAAAPCIGALLSLGCAFGARYGMQRRRCLSENRYFIGFLARRCTAAFFSRIRIFDAIDVEIAWLFSLFQNVTIPVPSR
jgi:hypothetical protein